MPADSMLYGRAWLYFLLFWKEAQIRKPLWWFNFLILHMYLLMRLRFIPKHIVFFILLNLTSERCIDKFDNCKLKSSFEISLLLLAMKPWSSFISFSYLQQIPSSWLPLEDSSKFISFSASSSCLFKLGLLICRLHISILIT